MKTILQDIKNEEFRPVYLLYGTEDYLKRQYRDRLLAAMNPARDEMNQTRFSGRDVDIEEVISLGDTIPFFADRRLILLEDTGLFKRQCPELADYIGRMPSWLHLIFVETEIDRRGRLYKAVKNAGYAAEFGTQNEKTLMLWILSILKREGRKITQPDMEAFLARTGTDMSNIENELEKLLCYTMGRSVITAQDIDAVCANQIDGRIFAMVQAVADRNRERALSLYFDLLALREPAMRILFLLARQFHLLLQVHELLRTGAGTREMAEKTGLQSFVLKNYTGTAGKYTRGELRRAIGLCTQTEEQIKTGVIGERLGLELLITELSSAR